MNNTIKLVRACNQESSKWSGGTTTQLLIHPENAVYSEKNFKWRLSTAKVEVEESTFTYLPGISRIIMIIDGKMILDHDGLHSSVLNPFDQDSFMGDWTTKSIGKATDFNLMMAKGCGGELEVISLKQDESIRMKLGKYDSCFKHITEIYYAVKGSFELLGLDEGFIINEKDLIATTRESTEDECIINLHNHGNEETNIIRTIVIY